MQWRDGSDMRRVRNRLYSRDFVRDCENGTRDVSRRMMLENLVDSRNSSKYVDRVDGVGIRRCEAVEERVLLLFGHRVHPED